MITTPDQDRYALQLEHAAELRDIKNDRTAEMKDERKADATAILAKCGFMLTGYETQVCEFASGVANGMHEVDMDTFTTLRTQFSKEISDYRNR